MRRAFTLIELLVVISIIAVLIGVLFPVLSAIMNSGKVEAGVNTISVAVSAARTYATTLPRASLQPTIPLANFDGAAAIFCPNGEIRLVENSQGATSTGDTKLEADGRNGYVDIHGVDYITLPKGTGVVGISRGNGGLYLFSPPFAIRFNRQGGMVAGISEGSPHRLVYYDSNYDGRYRISTGSGYNRASPYGGGTYDPDKWDPTSDIYEVEYDSNSGNNYGFNPTVQKHTLPFEEIESVIGVIVFNKNDLRSANHHLRSEGTSATTVKVNSAAAAWIQANGKSILFSRLTGKMMRE